jgi:AmiR/NasT family two-component response regulator
MKANMTPNFRGWNALILHREHTNECKLAQQLSRLGVKSECRGISTAINFPKVDIIFVDVDEGIDEIFPWLAGNATIPLIGLLGSEAPGRLAWALAQGISSHILKPISNNGVFSALTIAKHNYDQRQQNLIDIEQLQQRIKLRPVVLRCTLQLMEIASIDDTQAFNVIRGLAMEKRLSIEELCVNYVDDSARLNQLYQLFFKNNNYSRRLK